MGVVNNLRTSLFLTALLLKNHNVANDRFRKRNPLEDFST